MTNSRMRNKQMKKELEEKAKMMENASKYNMDYANMSVFEIAKGRIKTNIKSFVKEADEKHGISKGWAEWKQSITKGSRYTEATVKVATTQANEKLIKPTMVVTQKGIVEPAKYVGLKSVEVSKNIGNTLANDYQNEVVLPLKMAGASIGEVYKDTKTSVSNYLESNKQKQIEKEAKAIQMKKEYIEKRNENKKNRIKKMKIAMMKYSSLSKEEKLTMEESPMGVIATQAAAVMSKNLTESFKSKFGKYVSEPLSKKLKDVRESSKIFVKQVEEKKQDIDKKRSSEIER